ncbi:MAG: TIGR03032 family protein [Pseudomonadota bacterium]
MTDPVNTQAAPTLTNTDITFSGGLQAFLHASQCSLAFTSYQTGFLYLIGPGTDGKLAMHQAQYPHAMGVVGDQQRIYLGAQTQLIRLENGLVSGQVANNKHDKVFVPRNQQTIGAIDIHELGIRTDGRVVFVNTKYSCLCELSLIHSFKPIWKPSFISKIAPEDRCHLNGLAMVEGEPRFVSAVCKSDVVDGWRDRRHDGGIIIDVQTDEIIAEGLSMPHSPRFHHGRIWVANSGTGEIGTINTDTKQFEPFAFCPGFIRGMAFLGDHVVVTLSKPRYQRFDGLTLADRMEEKDADPWCGVQIISLADGSVSQWIRFDGAIQELFDVTILPGVQDAITIGLGSLEIQSFVTFET